MTFQVLTVWDANSGPIPFHKLQRLGELILRDAAFSDGEVYHQLVYRYTGTALSLRQHIRETRNELGIAISVEWEPPDIVQEIIDALDERDLLPSVREWLSDLPTKVGALCE